MQLSKPSPVKTLPPAEAWAIGAGGWAELAAARSAPGSTRIARLPPTAAAAAQC